MSPEVFLALGGIDRRTFDSVLEISRKGMFPFCIFKFCNIKHQYDNKTLQIWLPLMSGYLISNLEKNVDVFY